MRKGAILLLVLSLVLVACRASTGDGTVPAGESSVPSPTSTSTSTSTAATSLADADPPFPAKVQTDLGPVAIESEPQRIVSLSASHTEMLYALGVDDRIVATDLASNFPPAAQDTVKLDSFSFNIEEVAALDPDLVIVAFDFQGEPEALAALDIPFLLLGPPPTIEHAFSQLLNVGVAVGRAIEAVTLTEGLVAEVGRISGAAAPLRGITVFHEVDEAFYSASAESFIGDLYSRLGLVNIADAADVDGPFPQLSAEFIVDQDPEFIFLGDADFGVTPESVAARPGWETMRAVTAGNIVELDGDIAGRWGPRTVDLLAKIFETVEAKVP